jgi:hypothetical protein
LHRRAHDVRSERAESARVESLRSTISAPRVTAASASSALRTLASNNVVMAVLQGTARPRDPRYLRTIPATGHFIRSQTRHFAALGRDIVSSPATI